MIPQNLLLAFLSLQGQDQGRSGAPQSSQLDLNVFDSVSGTPANYQVKGFGDVEPVRVEKHHQQPLVSIEEREIHRFPFERFAVGSYDDEGLKYHDDESGHVQITTNTTSHLWSLAESFPFINPRHNHKNVKGAYPNPAGITINFQKNWKEVHVTLGYLSDKGFAEGKFVVAYRANRKLYHEEFTIGDGWTKWIGKAPEGGPHEGIDHVNCKRHLNRGNKMMNIKGAAGLAKRAINRIVIAITNCYRTAVGKASYLITTDTGDTFSVSWCLANSLDTR